MRKRNILLLHISSVSGHRSASLAIEKALLALDNNLLIKNIDGFGYISPLAERIVNICYMITIKRLPWLWDYLYDNNGILQKSKKAKSLIYTLKTKKIELLFKEFKPDIVLCTQAFPCGMIADYKRRHNNKVPLIGVLTDYAPHSYWLDDYVDLFIVPAQAIKQRLIEKGIAQERIKICGIPIDSKFIQQNNREEILANFKLAPEPAIILIMGGGQGLGPIKQIVDTLDNLGHPVQLVVICGINKGLHNWLNKNKQRFQNKVLPIAYSDQVNDLMTISSFIVTKPGGLTSAEALSKSLPILIVNPLPGQESYNTRFLLEAQVALKANDLTQLKYLAQQLLNQNTGLLAKMRQKASTLAYPDSAFKIANIVLDNLSRN